MTEKLTIPKDKTSIGVIANYFQDDELLTKGSFLESFDPKLNQPIIWAKVVVKLANKILNAHGIDSSLKAVVYSPKTEDSEEILTYNGNIKFEIQ